MKYSSQWWILSSAILLLTISVHSSRTLLKNENGVKTAIFLSPAFVLGPGSVSNKDFLNVDFPRGHIALKDFNGEVIDEAGNPIPLYETYLHHWVVGRYYSNSSTVDTNITVVKNAGVCQGEVLRHYYGLGSETRRTSTYVPDPYGIEVGNPAEIPNGYMERWYLNVHAIDTRGVVDRMGCTECRCNLYNVTKDENGSPLRKDYIGGGYCCPDQAQCRLRESFENVKRKLYLRYTVKWVDWHDSIVPVKIYIFDVTDSGKRTNSTSENNRLGCKDGRVICSSIPIYGNGKEAGNEDGYIVGMSTCYPKPGSVKISDGEVLTLKSNYSSSQMHTGVMGLFYILVADLPLKN